MCFFTCFYNYTIHLIFVETFDPFKMHLESKQQLSNTTTTVSHNYQISNIKYQIPHLSNNKLIHKLSKNVL